jgi:hypothetical protein
MRQTLKLDDSRSKCREKSNLGILDNRERLAHIGLEKVIYTDGHFVLPSIDCNRRYPERGVIAPRHLARRKFGKRLHHGKVPTLMLR